MAKLDIPLPEISTVSADEFDCSWTRFTTYVVTAKEISYHDGNSIVARTMSESTMWCSPVQAHGRVGIMYKLIQIHNQLFSDVESQ